MADWNSRVHDYLDELQEVADTIDLLLDRSRESTTQGEARQIDASTDELAKEIGRLHTLIAARAELLESPDAPVKGTTLTEKLRRSSNKHDHQLAVRCDQLGETIKTTHHRAISLFVCQYHLANLSSDIVNLISGNTAPVTYGPQQPKASGGGLLDQAA